MKTHRHLLTLALLSATSLLQAGQAVLRVDVQNEGKAVNPAMWGLFFEDINFGADGGLYAELVKNGSFEFPDPRMGWTKLGDRDTQDEVRYLSRTDATPANQRCVQLRTENSQGIGLSNGGFRGIGVKAGEHYDLTLDARVLKGSSGLRVRLVGPQGVLASAEIEALPQGWESHQLSLQATATEAQATLELLPSGKGIVEIDRVSLFPRNTWKQRPKGLRADLVQMLADMKPGFLRFPGGCIVEGFNLALRYQWKKTILPREERELLLNRWNVEFKDRPAPDYYQSFGLGFYEYFVLCEDIGAKPLPIINCGMACQYNSGELAPLDQLGPYIQDALDLIEFANGPVSSEWGAKRAALGHPEPFGLTLLGVGNEQWGPQYVERYEAFAKVLKAKHPEIELIAAAGPSPSDKRFDQLWEAWRRLKPAYVDEHSYSSPAWFIQGHGRYDSYDRNGPKVFVGEYACHTKERKNNLEAALAEAVFMIGLERNADVVRLAAYAPLFAHVDAWQWKPDMIWMDNLRVMPTPSYHVQSLFSRNRGDLVLPVTLSTTGESRLFASATWDKANSELIIKVANPDGAALSATLQFNGSTTVEGPVHRLVLTADNPETENTLNEPARVSPKETISPAFTGSESFPAYSFTVLRLKLKK